MIKVIAIIMSAASIAISVLAICKAAGEADREWEENDIDRRKDNP